MVIGNAKHITLRICRDTQDKMKRSYTDKTFTDTDKNTIDQTRGTSNFLPGRLRQVDKLYLRKYVRSDIQPRSGEDRLRSGGRRTNRGLHYFSPGELSVKYYAY